MIKLDGNQTANGYILGERHGVGAWGNTQAHYLRWSMKYNEAFKIYISLQTSKGHRYLTYTPEDSNRGLKEKSGTTYIHHGLGANADNGTWQTFTRDLAQDLHEYEPDNEIIAINAFLIRGSGYLDDIMLIVDPSMPIVFESEDGTPPVITLNGDAEITLTQGANYSELGATAVDDVDGNVSVAVSGTVNTATVGVYTITYRAVDGAGNSATKTRTVNIIKGEDMTYPIINISEENNSSISKTIIYPEITLELTTQNTKELVAINQTLIEEANQTIPIKGAKNGDKFYIYNIPLTKGANEINVTAISDRGVEASKIFTVHTEFNSTIPLGMRATKYSAVDTLETNITVGTSLDAVEYLLDINRDGVIDETKDDGNFTLTLDEEGRYKPRVTIRTRDGLLFSSDYFALSLDVKGDNNQIDPVGSDPLTLAKEFFQAILEDDRARVEELLAYNPRMLLFLYKNPNTLKEVKKRIPKIKPESWKMTYHNNGEATVTCIIQISDDDEYEAGFEFRTLSMQYNTGRFWYIKTLY